MLPGQGSQFRGMGRGVAREHPVFRATFEALSDIAEQETGQSMAEMVSGPGGTAAADWGRVRLTHPLVLAFHYAWAKALESEGVLPDLWLGYSMGELTACTLAGAIPIEEAVLAACHIGRLAEERTPPATMMAVLDDAGLMQREHALYQGATLACRNYAEHFVVSGEEARLRQIRAELNRREITAEILPVDRGFHADFILPLRSAFATLLPPSRIGTLRTPVWSCCLGRALGAGDLGPDFLWRIHYAPVDFQRTASELAKLGSFCWVDLSATGTLAGFAKRLLGPGAEILTTLTPFGPTRASLERLKQNRPE